MDVIEKRDLFAAGKLTVRGALIADPEADPTDSGCYDRAEVAAWRNGNWQYVGVVVEVRWDDVEVSRDSLWSVEHGDVDGRDADAWDPSYPLADLVDQALTDADRFLGRAFGGPVPADAPLAVALREARAWHATLAG